MNSGNLFMFSDKVYNRLKWLVQIALPAFGTLYFTIAQIWSLPAADEVVGTIVAITTFLGISLGISTKTYNASDKPYDGDIVVSHPDSERTILSLELDDDPAGIEGRDAITFKVRQDQSGRVPDVSGKDISGPRPPEH